MENGFIVSYGIKLTVFLVFIMFMGQRVIAVKLYVMILWVIL